MFKMITYNRRQTRVDVGLVKTKTTGLGVRMGDMKNLEKNTCMCLYLEKRDTRFRKGVRLGASRMDGMQSGEVEGWVLYAVIQTLGGDSKTSCMWPKVIIKNYRIFQ